ncbi:MAG: FadR/GntR family transcriptional regulator [Marinobacter sp.]|uniref:FadR/GntR family transcriptional regulator n=1 Tax=Marinobacter sp. TaxID=50741 RepID=UPI00299EF331|nr:FadR/GntR family transcriptional regulator [Marinobacter sp.]MDX1634007.1 FadR/GntR family transcriptional regulator [Marinobacter sp.]
MSLGKLNRGSLVDTAITNLRGEIESGRWGVGDRLPVEAALAKTLGVSRNTVREAVRVLAHSGMLETRQGDGTYVRARRDSGEIFRRIRRTAIFDQLEVRLMLETEAARLAAQRRSEQDLAAMTEALAGRGSAGDLDTKVDWDERFHQAVVRASGNQALMELYRYFADSVRETIRRTEQDQHLPEPSQADHEQLLDAIRQQDPAEAQRLTRHLLLPSLNALEAHHATAD